MKIFTPTLSLTTCKKIFLFFCFFTGLQICSDAQPIITSLSSAFGKIGDTIAINGSGFSTNITDNTVFFGGVKSGVLSATLTELKVRVPYGATYQPVSVTTNNLTAYSAKKFNVVYAQPGGIIPGIIEQPKIFTGGTTPSSMEAADMDGDGKTDLVMANDEARTLSVFKNNASISFNFDTAYNRSTVGRPASLTLADFNGDGKLDIAVITSDPIALKIFRNISTSGTILLDTAVTYISTTTSSNYYSRVKAGDIDLDGKPDIVLSEYTQLSIFRNNANASSISFEPKKNFSVGSNLNGIEISDMDGNGKPDVLVAVSGNSRIAILSNESTPGVVTLTSQQSITTNIGPYDVIAGDMDGNGKADLTVLISSGVPAISVYRNISTSSGSFQFASAVTVRIPNSGGECKLNDIDGDGKPDITFSGQALGFGRLHIIKNTSNFGSISLAPILSVGYSLNMNVPTFGDFDNDGKADIAVADYRDGTFSVYRNKSNEPVISSFTPTVGTAGTIVTIKGLNLSDVNAVKFGNTSAGVFTIVSDSVITATAAAGETGSITTTSPRGTFISGEDFSFNIPTITSFAPQSGEIGTVVTISGNNFSPIATDNIVYFGAVRAVVQSATATVLNVVVPPGASFQPLTVTVARRTAAATKPFTIMFPAARSIDSVAFAARTDIALTGRPYDIAVADFDNDGKPDLAVANNSYNNVSILRNISTGNVISFAARVDIPVSSYSQSFITTGDLNGDGKLDIVIANSSVGNLDILVNTTIGSNITFSKVSSTDSFPGTQQYLSNTAGVIITDFDGDRKPDIGVANGANTAFVSFFRNISRGAAIIFAPKQNVPSAIFPYDFVSGDVDGDGKPDAVVSNWTQQTVSIYKNRSTSGSISFDTKIDSATAGQPYRAGLSDIDGDGKSDIAVSCYTGGVASVLRNTSANGNISFARKTDFTTAANTTGFTMNDIDGDGKPDIVTSSSTGNNIAVLRNTSTIGTIGFATRQLYTTGVLPYVVKATDLNGDGAPDLISANANGVSVSIFRNKLMDTLAVAICPPVASTSIAANLTGSAYQWQVNTGSGFVNVVDNSNYSGSQNLTLQLSNIPSAWHGYKYRSLVDGNYSSVFVLKVRNLWTGAVNNGWENAANWSCGTVPDANTDVTITSGSVVLNSNTTCGSVTVISPASLTITSGNTLTVTR